MPLSSVFTTWLWDANMQNKYASFKVVVYLWDALFLFTNTPVYFWIFGIFDLLMDQGHLIVVHGVFKVLEGKVEIWKFSHFRKYRFSRRFYFCGPISDRSKYFQEDFQTPMRRERTILTNVGGPAFRNEKLRMYSTRMSSWVLPNNTQKLTTPFS